MNRKDSHLRSRQKGDRSTLKLATRWLTVAATACMTVANTSAFANSKVGDAGNDLNDKSKPIECSEIDMKSQTKLTLSNCGQISAREVTRNKNELDIVVDGQGNSTSTKLSGSGNRIKVRQSGTANTVSINQTGNGNTASIVQKRKNSTEPESGQTKDLSNSIKIELESDRFR